MSKAPFMPLFCDAYLGDTMHMSLEEHGAYLKLLMVTWRNNGVPLPDEDARLARILGVTVSRWRAKLRPVLEPLFDLSGGVWRSVRLEKEWNFVQKNAAVSRENGKRGGRPKSLKDNDAENPAGSLQGTQSETTHTHKEPNQPNQLTSDPIGSGVVTPLVDPKTVVFRDCLAVLVSMGIADKPARSFLGQCRSKYSNSEVICAVSDCQKASPSDPIPWLVARLQGRQRAREPTNARRAAI